jgi:AbrB family looped-hinge helix DNA binding protein
MSKATLRISSRGQIVIPAWIRRKLSLSAGDELKVEVGTAGERTIVLRGHKKSDIEELLARGYEWLERAGKNLVEELHEAREKERAREVKNRAARRRRGLGKN